MTTDNPNDNRHTESPPDAKKAIEVPFGSNAIRLSAGQWAVAALLFLLSIAAVPRMWSYAEPTNFTADDRIPYEFSDDYWLYSRRVTSCVADRQVLVIGDSVIWGEYVTPRETLSHYLNEESGDLRFANGGLNGTHPLALGGLVQHYASDVCGQRVILHCNLLWMSSPERDLQVDKEVSFNHATLVPQFTPQIPCYRASFADRMAITVDRSVPFRAWAKHLRVKYFAGQDLHTWSFEHPYENPLREILNPEPREESPRHPSRPWFESGLEVQDVPWIELDTSLQWQAFRQTVELLQARDNNVFVILTPLNEHMLTAESRQRYRATFAAVENWLRDRQIAYAAPTVLPSDEFADLSHPLAPGYVRLAKALRANESFQRWRVFDPAAT
jgi:hypothetical protein